MSRAEYVHTHYGRSREERTVHSPAGYTLGTIERVPLGYYVMTDRLGRPCPPNTADTLYRAIECVSEGPTGTGTGWDVKGGPGSLPEQQGHAVLLPGYAGGPPKGSDDVYDNETPTCDICGEPWEDGGEGEDWNGDTGNHVSCEAEAVTA